MELSLPLNASSGTALCVVLQNPSPALRASISSRNAETAAMLLGHDSVILVNLLSVPSRNSRDLEALGPDTAAWIESRHQIQEGLGGADEVLFGWGHTRLGAGLEPARREQVRWVRDAARQAGHTHAWTVGPEARHPSRWRQYVGPVRGLFAGDTFEERLRLALQRHPV